MWNVYLIWFAWFVFVCKADCTMMNASGGLVSYEVGLNVGGSCIPSAVDDQPSWFNKIHSLALDVDAHTYTYICMFTVQESCITFVLIPGKFWSCYTHLAAYVLSKKFLLFLLYFKPYNLCTHSEGLFAVGTYTPSLYTHTHSSFIYVSCLQRCSERIQRNKTSQLLLYGLWMLVH